MNRTMMDGETQISPLLKNTFQAFCSDITQSQKGRVTSVEGVDPCIRTNDGMSSEMLPGLFNANLI